MSKRAVGFLTTLSWLLAMYFFGASRLFASDAYGEAERTLVTGLTVLAGGFALTAFACSCAYLALKEEARLRAQTERENDARDRAATD